MTALILGVVFSILVLILRWWSYNDGYQDAIHIGRELGAMAADRERRAAVVRARRDEYLLIIDGIEATCAEEFN